MLNVKRYRKWQEPRKLRLQLQLTVALIWKKLRRLCKKKINLTRKSFASELKPNIVKKDSKLKQSVGINHIKKKRWAMEKKAKIQRAKGASMDQLHLLSMLYQTLTEYMVLRTMMMTMKWISKEVQHHQSITTDFLSKFFTCP